MHIAEQNHTKDSNQGTYVFVSKVAGLKLCLPQRCKTNQEPTLMPLPVQLFEESNVTTSCGQWKV